jgi:hypothetical protein
MVRGPELTDIERRLIIELHDVEIPVKEIMRRLQRSESLVRGVLRDPDGVERKKRPGRDRILTDRELRHIFNLACHQHLTPRKIIYVLKLDCSARTVRRALKSNKNAHYIKRRRLQT